MKIIAISDTHGNHRHLDVPDGDVLISCGDWSPGYGCGGDTQLFLEWVVQQPHRHKIAVPGNHEIWMETYGWEAQEAFVDAGVVLLDGTPDHCTAVLDGVAFGGGPWSMETTYTSGPWAFLDSEEFLDEVKWKRIPHVDVLMSHVPPLGILDETSTGEHLGCPVLRKHVMERIRPRVHFFGHVHHPFGETVENDIRFVNASSCTPVVTEVKDGMTIVSRGVRRPVVVELDI